jgi:threonine/homoserine/homoserine lactone efflux protein
LNADLLAVVVLGFAGSGSPGPNNALLLASGLNYGFKRTIPHIAGAAAGVSLLVSACLAGL